MDDPINMRPLFKVGDKVRVDTETLSERIIDDVNDRYKAYGCSIDDVFEIIHVGIDGKYYDLSYNGKALPYTYAQSLLEPAEDIIARDSGELMDFLRGGE